MLKYQASWVQSKNSFLPGEMGGDSGTQYHLKGLHIDASYSLLFRNQTVFGGCGWKVGKTVVCESRVEKDVPSGV